MFYSDGIFETLKIGIFCVFLLMTILSTIFLQNKPAIPMLSLICFLKKLIYFNWRIITLQYCGSFCNTLTWISQGSSPSWGVTCVSPSWTTSHAPPIPPPIDLLLHYHPFQYSCLEHPMDRGAWQATVYRVAKSQTWLKWLSMHTHIPHGEFYKFLKMWQCESLSAWFSNLS